MNQGSKPSLLHVTMALDSAVSLDDFRTHVGGAIVELLLMMERAAQLIIATCKEMPETAEKATPCGSALQARSSGDRFAAATQQFRPYCE